MKCVAWVTDPHLNFVDERRIEAFCQTLLVYDPLAVLVSGDIGEADSVATYLRILESRLRRPVCFVLGNHDFYGGSILEIRDEVTQLSRDSSCLKYLTTGLIVPLDDQVAVIGHDGWADGRLGDWHRSTVELNDYHYIAELTDLDRAERQRRLNALGDEVAAFFADLLPRALAAFQRLFLVTHVPPFAEACWYEGHHSDRDWLPHFASRAPGEVLARIMRDHPDRSLTVLCGHTHSPGEARILPNLVVRTGGAIYGSPEIEDLIAIR